MTSLRHVIQLLRPGDWVKNVFVLPAVVAGVAARPEDFDVAESLVGGALAVGAFCLLASGVYAINDVVDAASDRRHPIKRHRPVASGAVSAASAVLIGIVLIIVSLVTAFAVNSNLGLVLSLYAVLQAAYNVKLKRVIFVDVVVVAIGFGLRAAAGAVAIKVEISIWLILCVFFLCLYLAFIKRLCDIASAERADGGRWHTPAGYDDRAELNWLLGISAVLAVMTYLLSSLSEHARAIFGDRTIGFALMTPLVLIAVHRVYRRANSGASDSPLAALRDDRAVQASIGLFAIGSLVTLYVPQVEPILQAIFAGTKGLAMP